MIYYHKDIRKESLKTYLKERQGLDENLRKFKIKWICNLLNFFEYIYFIHKQFLFVYLYIYIHAN